MRRVLKRHANNKPTVIGGLVVVGIAALGTLLLVVSHAATPAVAIEPENAGSLTGVTKISDSQASGGSAIKFGSVSANPGGTFTFASLPDTQRDLWNMTSIQNNFNGRFNWLVQNRVALNLKYVWQVGDLEDTDNLLCAVGTPPSQVSTCSHALSVNPRYEPNPPFNIDHFQYYWASQGLKILEAAGMPYALTPGNHDTGAVCGGPACAVVPGQTQATTIEVRNTTTWNSFYPPGRFGLSSAQGTNAGDTTGIYEPGKSDNAYRTFSAGGLQWLLINYELWPRTGVVDWMKAVVASHPHYNVILITHSYLNGGGAIEGTNGGYGANSPQYVFDNLIKLYPNIIFTFSGHVGNSDYRVDTGVKGNKIYEFMDTYHDTVNNWIRLITVDTVNNTVKTKVYAPLTNQTRTEPAANVSISGISWTH